MGRTALHYASSQNLSGTCKLILDSAVNRFSRTDLVNLKDDVN